MQVPTHAHLDRDGAEHAVLILPSGMSGASASEGPPADESTTHGASPVARGTGRGWNDVPWRTIVATIGSVVATIAMIEFVYLAFDVMVLILIAGFFAIVLSQPVSALQRRFSLPRGAAIGLVVGATVTILVGLITLFILPVRTQLVAVLTDLPGTVEQASLGKGPIGNLTTKLNLVSVVRDNQESLADVARSIENSLPSLLSSLLGALLQTVTVVVLTILMLSQSAALGRTAVQVVPVRYRTRVIDTAKDAAASVSGYMIGNLLISMFAGLSACAVLLVLGVPNAIVIALFVAFVDLIPLVGATIGAVVAVAASFIVSPTVGIIALVFFVVYQQFENSVLQVVIMSRRARANPLVVLLSVLLGVELMGIVGALLAIPVAGALSVILSSVWRHRPLRADELLIVSDGNPDEKTQAEERVSRHIVIIRWLSQRFSLRHNRPPRR